LTKAKTKAANKRYGQIMRQVFKPKSEHWPFLAPWLYGTALPYYRGFTCISKQVVMTIKSCTAGAGIARKRPFLYFAAIGHAHRAAYRQGCITDNAQIKLFFALLLPTVSSFKE